MLGKFVIHTHPVAANALNCGPGLKALEEITPAGELPPLWVPYTDPGWRLAHYHQVGGGGLSTSTMAACPWSSSWRTTACWFPPRRRKPVWRSMRNG